MINRAKLPGYGLRANPKAVNLAFQGLIKGARPSISRMPVYTPDNLAQAPAAIRKSIGVLRPQKPVAEAPAPSQAPQPAPQPAPKPVPGRSAKPVSPKPIRKRMEQMPTYSVPEDNIKPALTPEEMQKILNQRAGLAEDGGMQAPISPDVLKDLPVRAPLGTYDMPAPRTQPNLNVWMQDFEEFKKYLPPEIQQAFLQRLGKYLGLPLA